MPGTTGRPAEILRARGGSIRVSASREFQAKGFYMSGCVSLVLAVLKLTEMKQWSWWRVFRKRPIPTGSSALIYPTERCGIAVPAHKQIYGTEAIRR